MAQKTILTRKRVLKGQITKLKEKINAFNSETEMVELELFKQKCQKFSEDVTEVFNQIYDTCEEKAVDMYLEEQDTIQNLIDELSLTVNREIAKQKSNSENSLNCSKTELNTLETIKLPKLMLPMFSGNVHEWLAFSDLFKASVHNNTTLSNAQKLQYLKSSLKGDAFKIVQSIAISDANYEIAWDLLKDRYSNIKDQVFVHLKRFMAIPPIQSEAPFSILKLVDTANECVRSLEILEQKAEGFSEVILAYILLQKLDSSTKLWWERESKKDELPKYSELILFLKNYARTLQASKTNCNATSSKRYQQIQRVTTLTSSVKNSNPKCTCCNSNESHYLYKCPKFKSMSVPDRVEFAKKYGLCYNCLSNFGNHSARNCKSKFVCRYCSKRHNSLLHFEGQKPDSCESVAPIRTAKILSAESFPSHVVENSDLSVDAKCFESKCINNEFVGTCINETQLNPKDTLLSTAVIFVKDIYGKIIPANCLLDSGSQSSYISSELANNLGIKKERINISVSCLSAVSLTVKSKITTEISNNSDYAKTIDFLVVSKINDVVPGKYFGFPFSQIPEKIKLADPHFNKPKKIQVLLGVQCFYDILKPDRVRLPNSSIMFQDSVFGFIATGSISELDSVQPTFCGLSCKIDEDLNTLVKNFWEIENSYDESNGKNKNMEEIICEEHFVKTHSRDNTGKYTVQIPFKEDPSCIGESKITAVNRLNSLWKRLERDPEYLNLYRNFIHEYENLEHMELVNEKSEPEVTYYLPHHGVFRLESSSTPLRVVFNASQLSSTGVSLNSVQYKGGVIQDDLFSILIRFRKHFVAFIADIKQMYRMISIEPSQRDLQRIVWKEGINEPIKTYRLSTITYGTASAPFLATRTLKQLALDEEENFPVAAEVTKNDFYMDDVVTSSSDLETAREVQTQLNLLLEKGGMKLHKWASSESELLNNSASSPQNYSFTKINETKALGILWNHQNDEFSFNVKVEHEEVYTKRTVLSTIAKIFDPLGLISPVITRAKIFMQRMWLLHIEWNDPLPEKESREWQDFVSSMKAINNVAVRRCILIQNSLQVQIHGFADACEKAFGAAVYVKSISSSGEVAVHLLCSKSRVAPIKRITIPRLELCGAVLLAQLIQRVLKCLRLDISDVHLFSDSTIVLAWLKNSPHVLKPFVANRVTTIQDLTGSYKWHHVCSEQNPADLVSRGIDPRKILYNELWWNGPTFLRQVDFPCDVGTDTVLEKEEYTCELKGHSDTDQTGTISLSLMHTSSLMSDIINLSNNFVKILRILSFVFRFYHNARNPTEKLIGHLTTKELAEAEIRLIKSVQNEYFCEEMSNLKKGKPIPNKSKLRFLNAFLDDNQVLRVGGRLKNSDFDFQEKHPVILPDKCKLTKIIVEYFHKKNFHVGPQSLLCFVRQKFWPINGRSLCRSVVHNCSTCFRTNPVTVEQIMGDLPPERVRQTFPFNVSGVDFCGPFMVKDKRQRKHVLNKVYVAIFVCFVTRAVHLEVVADLTSESFLAALKRFFSRRGKSSKIFSDNATNFVGANSEIKKLHNLVRNPDENLAGYFASESIEWSFLPPRAPNFGGLWEAGVKSFKHHLRRVMRSSVFTYEEFETVTIQVEGILNSRPITPLSSDGDDFEALTPGHFLIGRPINALVEPDLIDLRDNRLSRWQKTTKTIQHLWKRWHRDYLNTLQQRSKWMVEKSNIKLGSLVVIKEDNLPVCKWALGRIKDVHPGTDGKVRVVSVQTPNCVLKRSISKICILPVNDQ